MARQRGADFFARRHSRSHAAAPVVAERCCLHDKSRRAESALQRILRHEGLLHRVQFCCANTLDGDHGFARRRARRQQAAHHRCAVDQHGAGAADAGAAHELGAGQVERITHEIDEKRIGIVGYLFDAAVDRHRTHLRSPVLLREDFTARAGLAESFFGAGLTAPATSVRTMISRSPRKASAGCIAG